MPIPGSSPSRRDGGEEAKQEKGEGKAIVEACFGSNREVWPSLSLFPGWADSDVTCEHRVGWGKRCAEHDRCCNREPHREMPVGGDRCDRKRHHQSQKAGDRPPGAEVQGAVELQTGREQRDDQRQLGQLLNHAGIVDRVEPANTSRLNHNGGQKTQDEVDQTCRNARPC